MSFSARFLGTSPLYTASLTFYPCSEASTPVVKVIVVRHLVVFMRGGATLSRGFFSVLLGMTGKHDPCLGRVS